MTIIEMLTYLSSGAIKVRRKGAPKNEYYYLGSHGRIHNQNDEPVNVFAGNLFKEEWEELKERDNYNTYTQLIEKLEMLPNNYSIRISKIGPDRWEIVE